MLSYIFFLNITFSEKRIKLQNVSDLKNAQVGEKREVSVGIVNPLLIAFLFSLFSFFNKSCEINKADENLEKPDDKIISEIYSGNFCAGVEELIVKLAGKFKECLGMKIDISPNICESDEVKDMEYVMNISKTVEYIPGEMERLYREISNLVDKNCADFFKRSNLISINKKMREIPKRIFRGKLKEGQPCFFNFECGEGLFCGGELCPGVCERQKEEGEKCKSREECLPSLTCLGGQCIPLGEEGSPCGSDIDCKENMVCVDGRCLIPKNGGEKCKTSYECEYFCNTEKGVCTNMYFAEIGGSCGKVPDEDSDTFCKIGEAYCKQNPEKLAGVCVPLLSEGEKCSPESGYPYIDNSTPRCGDGLYCSSSEGVCRKIPSEGEECERVCMEGLSCVQGKCIKPKENGGTCLIKEECVSRNCVNGICKPTKEGIGGSCATDDDCSNANCRGEICCSPRI